MYYFSIENCIITTGNHSITTGNHPGLGEIIHDRGESSMTGGNRLDRETSMVGIDWLPFVLLTVCPSFHFGPYIYTEIPNIINEAL